METRHAKAACFTLHFHATREKRDAPVAPEAKPEGTMASRRKHLEQAAAWKRSERNAWIALGAGVLVAIALFVGWNILLLSGTMQNSIFVLLLAFLIAFILGTFGNKVAKASRECRKILMAHDLSNEDLKEYMRAHKG